MVLIIVILLVSMLVIPLIDLCLKDTVALITKVLCLVAAILFVIYTLFVGGMKF